MKRIAACLFALLLSLTPALAVHALGPGEFDVAAPSAILMEKQTGAVLYEKNAYEHLAPASVTKVMTMLLVVEAVADGSLSLDETVTASARAASMGGSQIWLEEGEQMSVGEMLKCVTVVSANDCCVALAEHMAGSEEAFVARMNRRAEALGLRDTHFTSCSGLSDSDEHYTCAHDLAVISRELICHDMIKDYTTIWMDSIRNGAFGLSNTNKLIFYYPGATGLKTGFTAKAMYCLAATAERDGTEYIAVVLHAPSSAERFESAKALLNLGFGSFALVSPAPPEAIAPVEVSLGVYDCVQPVLPADAAVLVEKEKAGALRYAVSLPARVDAPVAAGQQLGTLTVCAGDEELQTLPLLAEQDVPRQNLWQRFRMLLDCAV
jgi:D-alanyl-D-alanine carboxypeptidase (penicillin-binding protein 5/6)